MSALDQPVSRYRQVRMTRKMRWWWEALADHMLAFPTITHQELADHFGKHIGTIGIILGSDAFNAYMRQRRAQFSASHDNAIRAGLYDVAQKSSKFMLEVMEKKRDNLPLEMLHKINESATKALGFGGETKGGPSVVVNNNTQPMQVVPVAVSIEDLEMARAALRRSQEAQLAPPVLQIEHDEDESRSDGAQVVRED